VRLYPVITNILWLQVPAGETVSKYAGTDWPTIGPIVLMHCPLGGWSGRKTEPRASASGCLKSRACKS
jgi:hypothetical protein